jgi:hypothetical protein
MAREVSGTDLDAFRFPGGSPDSVATQREKTLQVRLPVAAPSDS